MSETREPRDDAGAEVEEMERALGLLGIAQDDDRWHWTHANGSRHDAPDAVSAAAALVRSYQLSHRLANDTPLRAFRDGLRTSTVAVVAESGGMTLAQALEHIDAMALQLATRKGTVTTLRQQRAAAQQRIEELEAERDDARGAARMAEQGAEYWGAQWRTARQRIAAVEGELATATEIVGNLVDENVCRGNEDFCFTHKSREPCAMARAREWLYARLHPTPTTPAAPGGATP